MAGRFVSEFEAVGAGGTATVLAVLIPLSAETAATADHMLVTTAILVSTPVTVELIFRMTLTPTKPWTTVQVEDLFWKRAWGHWRESVWFSWDANERL
jgi:hypothetical protein